MTQGIYTAGNDRVLSWLVAMLTSVREHSADIPIVLIPFDGELTRTRRLCRRFDVEILAETECAEIDAFSRELLPGSPVGLMRRFSSFWGPFQHFLYLDADVIALQSVVPLLDAVTRYTPSVLYLDSNLDEVYRPGPLRAEMVSLHNARGINAGVFGGTRGTLSIERLRDLADEYRSVSEQLVPLADQTYLNFVLDRSDVPCLAFADVLDVCGGWPARQYHAQGDAWFETPLTPSQTPPGRVALLHWAGYRLSPSMPLFRLWLTYRAPRWRRLLFAVRLGAPMAFDRLSGPLRSRLKLRSRIPHWLRR